MRLVLISVLIEFQPAPTGKVACGAEARLIVFGCVSPRQALLTTSGRAKHALTPPPLVVMVVVMIVIMVMMVIVVLIVMMQVGGHDTRQADRVMWMVVTVTAAIVCRGRRREERDCAETRYRGSSKNEGVIGHVFSLRKAVSQRPSQ